MKHGRWSWMMTVAALVLVSACAPQAADKMREAEHDVAEAWRAERDAAVQAMRSDIDSVNRQVDAIRARAAELEGEAEAGAAELWRRTADELESVRNAAARDIEALENAGADAWESTKHAASESIEGLARAERRVAAFAAETKDEFVAGARAAVEESERELVWAKEKLAEAGDRAKEEWHDAVEVLEEKHRAAMAELDKVERADAEAWNDMRHGFVAAYHDLQDASERAAAHFEEI